MNASACSRKPFARARVDEQHAYPTLLEPRGVRQVVAELPGAEWALIARPTAQHDEHERIACRHFPRQLHRRPVEREQREVRCFVAHLRPAPRSPSVPSSPRSTGRSWPAGSPSPSSIASSPSPQFASCRNSIAAITEARPPHSAQRATAVSTFRIGACRTLRGSLGLNVSTRPLYFDPVIAPRDRPHASLFARTPSECRRRCTPCLLVAPSSVRRPHARMAVQRVYTQTPRNPPSASSRRSP